MDARRALPFLLLVICTINAAFSIHNDRGGVGNLRRVRRISEYLVPPPPPRFHSPGRLPRLANYQSANEPGYFSRLMNWLNPFASEPSPPSPPPPPPLPPEPETYPPKFVQSDSLPLATTYNGPSLADYQKPPLPPSTINDHSGYPASAKVKNCNSCNKVPWMPMQQSELTHSGYAPSLDSSLNHGGYPPRNPEVPHDTYHAASHEIRAPDFSFVPPLPGGQDSSFIGALPNPQLYPGAMPPLFKAEDFNYSPQGTSENSGYLGAASVSGNGAPTDYLDVARPAFNGEHNGQSVYPGPSGQSGVVPQEPGYPSPGANNGDFNHYHQDHAAPGDLSSSGTQVSHANPIPDKQGLEGNGKGSFGSINHQTFLGGSGVLDSQPPRVSNNAGSYITGSVGGFLDNTGQTDPNFPSSYGISDLDKIPSNYEHKHNDLSSSAEGSRAPLYGSDGSSGKIRDSINFEESPLIDFTHKDESRTHSSPIPSTSNALAGPESTENAGTVAPGDEIFGLRQGITSTESYFSADYFETIDTVAKESRVNNSAIQDVPRESFRDVLLKSYDDVTDDTLNDHINGDLGVSSEQQGGKRNKQVQVIIPYTSQYTPLPFHPSDERKVSGEPNHDSYVGEESRNRINVVKPPDSSPIFQFRPTILPIFEDVIKKALIKANNSIDVHKLQKNIDNWTIQKYSKSTAATTVSPSHYSSPYLLPSKTIPKEYFTTTEPIRPDSYNDNVKTFTLAGFSFDDEEYKGSISHRMEGSRVQVIRAENLTESSTDAPVSVTDMWRDFPVGISSDKERVYIVTPETPTTPISNPENRRSKAKGAESSAKESKKASQTNAKETKPDTFESIEKAYQVLPQAVNNLAVASTGPESIPLWGIMEHDDFASPVDNEYDNNDTEPSVLYSKLSKKSRGRR